MPDSAPALSAYLYANRHFSAPFTYAGRKIYENLASYVLPVFFNNSFFLETVLRIYTAFFFTFFCVCLYSLCLSVFLSLKILKERLIPIVTDKDESLQDAIIDDARNITLIKGKKGKVHIKGLNKLSE